MIERYTTREMGSLWSERKKKSLWVLVEIAVLWAKAIKLGIIPQEVYKDACNALNYKLGSNKPFLLPIKDLKRADQLEKISDHDLMALILAVAERLPKSVQPYWHDGLTSYCNEDTALAIQMVESLKLIIAKAKHFRQVLIEKAKEHKESLMIGRTHAIHAEPITFALKLLRWVDAIDFHLNQLNECLDIVGIGKISGAVGAYTLDPVIERWACHFLDLKPAKISSQIIGRHIHLHYMQTLVKVANTLDMIAVNIRTLSRTEIREVREYKKPGAHGSSAMPGKTHLKNPIKFENISGLAKEMRGWLFAALECELLWDERSLDNSSAERIHLPDASECLDFMLKRIADAMEKLEVYPKIMRKNIDLTGGIVFASQVLKALTEKGMDRREAYELLEDLATKTSIEDFKTSKGETFEQLVRKNRKIMKLVLWVRIDGCFDPDSCLENIQAVYERFGI